MGERRRFSVRERAALFVVADGRCEHCGCPLPPDWHADHVAAWARGGQTIIENGQALCPPCNLAKGVGDVRA